ncbi:MAG: hypothetical protein ABSA31_00070 [Acidimicrobiales bacterium]
MAKARNGKVWRTIRTGAALPRRVASNTERIDALERHVEGKIDEMRAELAEIRSLLHTQIEGDAEATALLGRLLQAAERRLAALEDQVAPTAAEAERARR